MKRNLGNIDRTIRLALALVMGALYLSGTVTGMLGIFLLVVSVIALVTSFMSFCPLYAILGINTCGN